MENISKRPSLGISVTSSTEMIIGRVRQLTNAVKEKLPIREGEMDEERRKRATQKLVNAGIYNKFPVNPDQVFPQDYLVTDRALDV